MKPAVTPLRIPLAEGKSTSALLCRPAQPRAGFVFAHGAGAGMTHPFMADLSDALCERGSATLR